MKKITSGKRVPRAKRAYAGKFVKAMTKRLLKRAPK